MNATIQPLLQSAFAGLPFWLKVAAKRYGEQSSLRARHRAAQSQLVRAAVNLSANCLSDVSTRKAWEDQRSAVREGLLQMLGLDRMPERGDLRIRQMGAAEHPDYRMERIAFESVPCLYVTANFYLPANRSGPVPCVIYLCGPWPSLDGAKTGYQDRYLWYPANGFALLAIDPVGFGEIHGVHPGTQQLNRWNWISRGYTPAGVEVWNAMRAVDFLETRPEIAAARIGATGISGGGVMTQYLAALDERVAVAAPSCSTFTLGDQAARGLVPRQCDCTFYPNVRRLDFPEVLALVAPRPLLILGGRKDPIFPPSGFREAYRRTKRIYDLLATAPDAAPRIRLVESDEGHSDPPRFLDETRRWMCRWLGVSVGGGVAKPSPVPEPPESLRCFDVVPISNLNDHVQDVWIPPPRREAPATRDAWAARRTQLMGVLRSRVLGWFPAEEIPFRTRRRMGSGGYAGRVAECGDYEFDTEPGVRVRVGLFTPKEQTGPVPLLVWVKGAGELFGFLGIDEFHGLLRTHALAALTPRLVEQPMSDRERADVERTAMLTGRSLAALQVWDVLRTVTWALRDRRIEASSTTVVGTGAAGIAGLYAAALDSTVGHAILRAPPASHEDGPALPTILRDTDIAEVAGLLAPRRLTLLSCSSESFAATRAIYALNGVPGAFGTAPSLPAAVRAAEIRGEAAP